MSTSRHSQSVVLLIATALLWSMGGVLLKSVEWHPLALAGARSSIAAVVIGLYILLTQGSIRFKWSFNLIAGALCYASTVTLYVAANNLTTNANAVVLQYTAPVYVALFGVWFLKEKLSVMDILIIVLVMSGVGLFFADKLTPEGMNGIMLALASGVTMGWMTLFVRKQKDGSSLESLLLGNILSAIIGIPFIMLYGLPPTNMQLLFVLILGAVQIGIPYILYARALRNATALDAVVITMLEPILSPLWVMLALGEKPDTYAMIGSAIVLCSVALRGVIISRRKPEIVA
jgi:drug/metabolite transporter (DMT)-like permease